MTQPPFRHRNDISPEDMLDAWLNARTSGGHDDHSLPEGVSLPGAAHEFHVWADFAQRGDPDATGPAADLWNTILERQRRDSERTDEMSTTIGMTTGGFAPPRSNRTRRAEAISPLSRSGAWFSAIAAALLVLTLGGGAYLARNGGFGFGGGDGGEGWYAAQAVTPEASPVANAATCDVEPLTTDEVVAYVENPNSYMPYGVFGTPPPDMEGMSEITEGLFEYPIMWEDVTEEQRGEVPGDDMFADAWAVADQYHACLTHGTQAHLWALISPFQVQYEVLSRFPVYRERTEIREYVETAKDIRFSDHEWSTWVDGSPDGRRVYANPNVTDARVFKPVATLMMDADLLMYMGEEHRDENEDVVSLTSWDATALQGGQEQSNGTSLILVHSESTDRWFVYLVNAPWG